MAKKPKPDEFQPYVVADPASALGGSRFARLLVVSRTFCGVRAVGRVMNVESQLGVVDRVLSDWQLPLYRRLPETEERTLQSIVDDLKNDALLHGATPEAVVLLGNVSPFSEKELNVMAEKLKKKTATKKAPKAETKAKAPKANAGEKATRAPRTTLDEKAKISLTEKGEARLAKGSASGAAANLAVMKKAKTVGKALAEGLKTADITYAVKTGTVELS